MYFKGYNPIKIIKSDIDLAKSFYIYSFVRTAYAKLFKKKLLSQFYAGHTVISQKQGNKLLFDALLANEPFMFGRNGSNEIAIATEALFFEKGIISKLDFDKYRTACNQCGFYYDSTDDWLEFKNLLVDACSQTDLYGSFRMVLEDYYIKAFMKKDIRITHLNVLDFWNYEIPFTYALKGKKVLVIHPLADKIKTQYEKREKLFSNPHVLPEFDLQVVRAVQSIGGQRPGAIDKWTEALDYMYSQTKNRNYEIALLGCGAYGMPLASKLKKDGKKVIYMGGVLQMLFGIRGKRWDLNPQTSKLYNEYWVSPSTEEIPINFKEVEDGCYW